MCKLFEKILIPQTRPSVYDTESATLLELSAKLLGSMNEVIEAFNKLVTNLDVKITEFETSTTKDLEAFETAMRQEFQDFIDIVSLKQEDQLPAVERALNDAIAQIRIEMNSALTRIETETDHALDEIRDASGEGSGTVVKTYNIKTSLKNVSASSSNATTIKDNYGAVLTFTANPGYKLPREITVTNSGGYIWNNFNGELALATGTTGDILVTIVGEVEETEETPVIYNIRTSLSNVTADPENENTVASNYGTTLKFTANPGYKLPREITATNCEYMWWDNTGELMIGQGTTGDILVTIVGEVEETETYTIKPGLWVDNGADVTLDGDSIYVEGNDGVQANTWNTCLNDADVTLPCRIDFPDGGVESWDFESQAESYVCYGITFQTDGRVTFNLEDATDVDAYCDTDDADQIYLTINGGDYYPNGIELDENQYKCWMAVFHEAIEGDDY